MTSPVPPVPEAGAPAPAALSPTKKIVLSGLIIALGFAAAGFHLRRPIETVANKAVDPVLAAAPLPSAETTDAPAAPFSASSSSSAPAPAPLPDEGAEKYAQAYPPPILVADEKSVRHPGKKTVKPNQSAEKPVVVIKNPEFKPVHQLSKPVPRVMKADRSEFKPIPKAKSSTGAMDELLPLFDFAENLKPLTFGVVAPVQPSNPFQAIGDLTPLRPFQGELVPLTPGGAAQGAAAKSSNGGPDY